MTTPSVEKQLLDEPVGQLELTGFCLVTADTTVRETIEQMRVMKQNCAFVVGEHTRLLGIFTDRDVLRKVVHNPGTWDVPVTAVMTQRPDNVPPTASTREAMKLMLEHHYRNLPVLSGTGAVLGNVTHYAILKYLTDHFPQEVYNLPPDPTNFAQQRDGG
jgi:CBS domain-containing protein